jgi:Tfp pilus assembly protein PilV
MSEIVDFLKENSQMIILIVIVVLGLLVLINIKGIDLNPPKPESKLVQEVTVETLDMMDKILSNEKINVNLASSFCESYLGNSQELEDACNQLTEDNCAETSCCIYTNNKCVAGGLNGPTYNTDKDGKLITMDTYYYLGKCRGSCPT